MTNGDPTINSIKPNNHHVAKNQKQKRS
jgi:hypothetical protein